MLNRIAVACLLSLAASTVLADDGERTEYALNLSESQFQAANQNYFAQGMRIIDLTVTEVDGKPVIGAIWGRYPGMREASPELAKEQLANVFLKLDPESLFKTTERMNAAGSVLEALDSYQAGGKTFFAVTFTPAKSPAIQSVAGMFNESELEQLRAQQKESDIMHLEAFGDDSGVRLAAGFVRRAKAEIDYGVFDSIGQIQDYGSKIVWNDMQPLAISVLQVDGKTKWFATWDAGGAREFLLTGNGSDIASKVAKGFTPIDLDSHSDDKGGVAYYAVMQAKL